jgi:putative transposase
VPGTRGAPRHSGARGCVCNGDGQGLSLAVPEARRVVPRVGREANARVPWGEVARRPRNVLPDGYFHVTARGVADGLIFREDGDRTIFTTLLHVACLRHRWTCRAWCLMGTHYHLVVESLREDLSNGLRRLNGRYAQGFNHRHSRRGHLFGDRAASWVIESEAHLEAACRYVLLNPVRAGLCTVADEWPWSGPAALKRDL